MGTIRPQIVLFGDSITEYGFEAEKRGWGAGLANHHARTADVVLRGFSGYNTRWVLPMLDKIFPINLSDHTHVVLITPPPVYEKALIIYVRDIFGDTTGVPKRRNEVTKMYADECVKVGEEAGVPVINLWSIFQETPNWQEELLCDGIHLSSEGNVKVFKEVVKILDESGLVPTLKANDMPWDFPSFYSLGDDPVAHLKNWSTPK